MQIANDIVIAKVYDIANSRYSIERRHKLAGKISARDMRLANGEWHTLAHGF